MAILSTSGFHGLTEMTYFNLEWSTFIFNVKFPERLVERLTLYSREAPYDSHVKTATKCQVQKMTRTGTKLCKKLWVQMT
jgi:hypothetical protein